MNDDVTVVTDNTSTGSITTTTDSIGGHTIDRQPTTVLHNIPRAIATRHAFIGTNNYYSVLDTDDDCIAVDSGASDNFGTESTTGTNRQPTTMGVTLASATRDTKTSIATDKFALPLPSECLDFHVYRDGDINRPLLSVGKACDAGLNVWFDHAKCTFYKGGLPLLTGHRDQRTGLYLLPKHSSDDIGLHRRQYTPQHKPRDDFRVDYPSTWHAAREVNTNTPIGLGLPPQIKQASALSAYQPQSLSTLIHYLHACAGYPTKATWIQAINRGYYIGWPGLTASRVQKYLGKSEETTMGHMRLVKQGVRSTSKGEKDNTTSKGERPTSHTIGRQRHVSVCAVPLTGVIGTDQTGRFPTTSARGHKYLFILFDVDTDYIYATPIKSRKASELVRAFEEAYDCLTECGFEPLLHKIDHETSRELVQAIKERRLQYQVMPPRNHRQNPAERAIQTFKSHFISILNGVDANFPSDQWDLLIPQTVMTLNMLRPCGVNDNHSAYAYIHGAFNFNAHPLVPLGCKSIAHERSIKNGGTRGSWGNKGRAGYYIGPAMKSYRVWCFYIPETTGVWETDTAEFFPRHRLPTVTAATAITEALDAIKMTLTEPQPAHMAIPGEGTALCKVINQLREMYGLPPRDIRSNDNDAHHSQQLPRVDQSTTCKPANTYGDKQTQRFPIGTAIKIKERDKKGKLQTFRGKAEQYDHATGLYRVEFDDGEFEEFNDTEMQEFCTIKPFQPRQPTTFANQITIPGFFPKASGTHTPLQCLNAGSIWDDELHKWMAYRDLIRHPNPVIRERWTQAGVNEFGRLTQGYGGTEGLDVVTFICKIELPSDKQATYARYVVDYRPEKDEPWRLRITCGGDKLEYDGDTTTHSATMETIKCHLNKIVSTTGARAATCDISNMYLGSDLPEAEYVKFRLDLIPAQIIEAYGLQDKAHNGYVYARVNKAWYGLKQAGKIAHDDLVDRLADGGYHKGGLLEGYFSHETRDISFVLVVDDFLVQYNDDADLEHLVNTVEKHYKFKVDTNATQFVGIQLQWDYDRRTVRLSMPGYVKQALTELEHTATRLSRRHHAPSMFQQPKYGSRVQYAKVDTTDVLSKDKITFIQRVLGKLLYYARAVDPTMLHAINDIAISAANGTEAVMEATVHLLNYAQAHPDAEILYRKSDMILRVDSDAAYLVAPQARSRAGGYHYLSDETGAVFNGPVLTVAKVIKNVMASATEAELGALFMNGQEAVMIRNTLGAMGFPQPPTPMKTDNNTANGIINNTMKQKRSKTIDVRFYWLRDRVQQGQFYIYWDAGCNNLADFYTKHHPPAFHTKLRPIHTYIEGISPDTLQGCIRIMNENTDKSEP